MDRFTEAADIIRLINLERNDKSVTPLLISRVCNFFDNIRLSDLSTADLKFLRFIASEIGIPHYYEMLSVYQDNELNHIDLKTFMSLIKESLLHIDEDIIIHSYQLEVLNKFNEHQRNRFFLSASTSFGKTFIVYEIIRKMMYRNIFLIFPTIALLSENLAKIYNDKSYSWIKESFDIHTLSETEIINDHNLFIFTPERFLSFMDRHSDLNIDFVFIDEIYKIDNDYVIEDEFIENERDIAYRLALFFALLQDNTDALLAGPYISFADQNDTNYNSSFDNFIAQNNFVVLNYNHIEIVNKYVYDIKSKSHYNLGEGIVLNFNSKNKIYRLISIIKSLRSNHENSIIYCHSRTEAESYAKKIIEDPLIYDIDTSSFDAFIHHLETAFNNDMSDWIVVRALKKGVGIHHGLIPKYIQKEIIDLFNNGRIDILLSTTTITEGINTSSKNMIVLSHKKGKKLLKKFDAKNIEGRAGRFLQHYSGRVLILQNCFKQIIEGQDECIKHKNYDLTSPKHEIDLFYTPDMFLSPDNIKYREQINLEQQELGIPDEIISYYKVVPKDSKMVIYRSIKKLSFSDLKRIGYFIDQYHTKRYIDIPGLELIINTIKPIVKDKKMSYFINTIKEGRNSCILTGLIISYCLKGLEGSIQYHLANNKTIDKSVSLSTSFIYNTLKYQVVKYFGVFNSLYKYHMSSILNKPIDNIVGLDLMLSKFEYNSFTKKGRVASDFGVSQKVIDYFDSVDISYSRSERIKSSFDDYEKLEYNKLKRIIDSKE